MTWWELERNDVLGHDSALVRPWTRELERNDPFYITLIRELNNLSRNIENNMTDRVNINNTCLSAQILHYVKHANMAASHFTLGETSDVITVKLRLEHIDFVLLSVHIKCNMKANT